MAGKKEYKLIIKIAGAVDPSLAKSLDSIDQKIRNGVGKLDGAFTTLDPAFDRLEAAGKKCFDTIAVAATAAAGAIGIIGSKVLDAGMSFEEQMSTVEAISGASGAEMENLSDKAKEIGKNTKFTAEEAGKAFEYMGMAGWKSEQMLDGVDGVINLAAAAGEDLALVSDIVTDDLTALGMTAEETQRFVDVFAAAVTNSNTNVELMGETFKYAAPLAGTMGYSVEDLAIATGLMANNGIKGSMAGTALRNIFQRMAKPTKESATAMEDLDLSLTNADGSMRSLMDIMVDLRESLGGHIEGSDELLQYLEELNGELEEGAITEEQYTEAMDDFIAAHDELSESSKLMEAAMLAGARGMAGLLAITNSTEEDFNKLTDAINNSAGAAEEMAKIRLDNLSGDVELFNDALSGLYVEIFDEVNPALRGLVDFGTEAVDSLGTWLPDMIGDIAEKIEVNLPKALEKVKEVADPLFDLTKSVFGFFINHGEEMVGAVAGVGAAIASYELVSNVTHIVSWLLKLDPVSLTIAGIVTSVGLIAGHLTTIRLEHEKLVDQSLAEHFGDISLSLSELQEMAEQIAGSGQLERIRNVLDEFSTLEETKKGLQDISEQLDKAEWKVSVGLVLSEEDKQKYQSNIQALVDETKTMLQQSFDADLSAASEGMSDSSGLVDRLARFYEAKQGELATIGAQLNNAITNAFEDGFLDFNETQIISNIRGKIAKIQSEVLADEYDIKMRMLDVMNFGDLNEASYENLINFTRDAYVERVEGIARIYATDVQNAEKTAKWEREELENLLRIHEIDEQEFAQRNREIFERTESEKSDAYNKYLADQADGIRRMAESNTGGLLTQYAEEIVQGQEILNDAIRNVRSSFSEAQWEEMAKAPEEFQQTLEDLAAGLHNFLEQGFIDAGLQYDMEGFGKLAEKLKPTAQDAADLKAEYEELGKMPPQGFLEGMDNVDLALAMAGDERAIYNVLLKYLSEGDPQYNEMIEATGFVGGKVPEGVAEGMMSEENLAKLDEGAAKLYDETKTKVEEVFEEGIDVDVEVRVSPIAKIKDGIGDALGGIGSLFTSDYKGFADGGIVSQKQLAWVAEEGPEVVIPLNDSERALSLWEQTGAVLNAKSRADEASLDEEVTNNSMVVTFAPVYNISGSTSRADAERIAQDGFTTFQKYMEQYIRKNNRVMWDRG